MKALKEAIASVKTKNEDVDPSILKNSVFQRVFGDYDTLEQFRDDFESKFGPDASNDVTDFIGNHSLVKIMAQSAIYDILSEDKILQDRMLHWVGELLALNARKPKF